MKGLGARAGLGAGAAAQELLGYVARLEPLAQCEARPLPIRRRAGVRRAVLSEGRDPGRAKPRRKLLVERAAGDGEVIGEGLGASVGGAGSLDQTHGGIEAGEGAEGPGGAERRLAVLRAERARQVRERLRGGGRAMAEPDIEGTVATLHDEGRLGALLAGALEHLGGHAGEVLDPRIERPDFEGGAAASLLDQGREPSIESVRVLHAACHRPVGRPGAELDAFFPEGLELEGELAGEGRSWRRDERSRWRSAGS